jgi:Mrp family chromosome partitioning ATPase
MIIADSLRRRAWMPSPPRRVGEVGRRLEGTGVSNALESLLQRRLLIVTGKGGTGKTTLAAALAVLAARRGLETVLVEVADEANLLALVAKDPSAVPEGDGREPR